MEIVKGVDLPLLLEDYFMKKEQLERITAILQEETLKVQVAEKLLAVNIGVITAAGFVTEVGNDERFPSPKQIQKLAGLEPKENSSGKNKGRMSISKRGWRSSAGCCCRRLCRRSAATEPYGKCITTIRPEKTTP